MTQEYREYFQEIEDKLTKLYDIAGKAREKGLDPTLEVEAKITRDIAERIEKLISVIDSSSCPTRCAEHSSPAHPRDDGLRPERQRPCR